MVSGSQTQAANNQSWDWLAQWHRRGLQQVDGASLALFRMLFGGLLLVDVVRYFTHDWVYRYYIKPGFQFSYVPGIEPWPGAGMYWHVGATGVLAALVALGWWYRLAAPLLAAALTYLFLLDRALYLNHFYLICLLAWLFVAIPAQRTWSLDRWFGQKSGPEQVPLWTIWLLRFQIGVVYFYGGIAKLNVDWLSGMPVSDWVLDRSDLPVVGPLLSHPWAGLVVAWAGVLIDLTMPFLLLGRRSFWVGAGIALCFHVSNALLFHIGIFPWLMLGTLVLFPRPDWPRRLFGNGESEANNVEPQTSAHGSVEIRLGTVVLASYVLLQLLVPLRHWCLPGDVTWTEEGHRFSWRMKLRDKSGKAKLYATDPVTGERTKVRLKTWLSKRQRKKMATHPDMILQFARFVADEAERQGKPRPKVTVKARASVNGGPRGLLIDPEVDLASVQETWGAEPWILPRPEGNSAASKPKPAEPEDTEPAETNDESPESGDEPGDQPDDPEEVPLAATPTPS